MQDLVKKKKNATSGIYLISSLIEKLPESEIFEHYQSNVPSESSFSQEIQLWKQNWANEKNMPTTGTVYSSTAVTSASVERANSTLPQLLYLSHMTKIFW